MLAKPSSALCASLPLSARCTSYRWAAEIGRDLKGMGPGDGSVIIRTIATKGAPVIPFVGIHIGRSAIDVELGPLSSADAVANSPMMLTIRARRKLTVREHANAASAHAAACARKGAPIVVLVASCSRATITRNDGAGCPTAGGNCFRVVVVRMAEDGGSH